MWVHLLLFAFILIIIVLQKVCFPRSQEQYLFTVLYLVVFFVVISFRSYSVGNDTYEYYRLFCLINNQPSFISASTLTRYEIGYVALNYFIGRITNNFTVLLSIITAFYLTTSWFLIKRYSRSIIVTFVLAFTFSLLYLAMNIERQCIAMGFFYLSIPYLEKKKPVPYGLIIIIASLFHTASIFLLFLAFLPNINFEDKKSFRLWIFFSVLSLIFLNYGIEFILSYFPYFQHYYSNSVYSQEGVRLASLVLFAIRIVIVLYVRLIGGFKYQINNDSNIVSTFDKLLFFDVVLSAMSIGFNLFDRIEKYFTLGFIIAVVNALFSLNKTRIDRKNKEFAVSVLVILSFIHLTITLFYRSNWSGIFPYSFYWS